MSNKKKNKKLKSVIHKKDQSINPPIIYKLKAIDWISALILFAVAIGIYFQTYHYEYVLDDTIVITDNQYVKEGWSGIDDIFTTESFQGYFGTQQNLVEGSRYRPLSIASFAVEQGLWGSSPVASHIINGILYGLTCMMLYWVLILLFARGSSKRWYLSVAFIASLLYTIHPLHIEAVANIKGRDEILAMLFSLWSMFYFIKGMQHHKILNISISAMLFFLGLLAKENTITFLAIIPASIYFFHNHPFFKVIKYTGVLVGITVLYLCIRTSVIGFLLDSGTPITDIMNNPFADMNASEKMATIFYTLGLYFKLSFFPHPLTHDYYPYHIPILQWTDIRAFSSLMLYLAIGIYTIIGIFRKWVIAYGYIVYLAALSIVSNLFVSVGTFMNERFLFMASMGTCIIAAELLIKVLPKYFKSIGRYTGYGILGVMIVFYVFKDFQRIPVWKNELTLNTAAVKISKNSARSNSFMATALFNEYKKIMDQAGPQYQTKKQQLLDDAHIYAEKARSILPLYHNANLMLSGIAAEHYKLDRNQTALLQSFKIVAQNRPDVEYITQYLQYLNSNSPNPVELTQFYNELGYDILFLQKNNAKWAIHYLELGLKSDPNNQNIHQNLAQVYQAIGNSSKAQYHFSK